MMLIDGRGGAEKRRRIDAKGTMGKLKYFRRWIGKRKFCPNKKRGRGDHSSREDKQTTLGTKKGDGGGSL